MKTLLTTLILLAFTTVQGQNWIDLGNIFWRTSPSNSIDGSSTKRHMNMFVANAKLPVVLNDDNVLIFGLEYQHNMIASTEPAFYQNYEFASSMLQLGWEHKWNDKSKMLFMAIPRFNSDYNDININHFQLGGIALGTTKRSDKFDWKYGVYYNGELFGPMIVPMFGFNWEVNEKMRLKMLIPLNLEFSYQPVKWFRTGLRFDGVNASYLIETNRYIDKADNNAWAFAEFHLGKNIWFHAKAGHSILRKYRRYVVDDKMSMKLGPVNVGDERWGGWDNVPSLFENGWSFEARFLYRLPL